MKTFRLHSQSGELDACFVVKAKLSLRNIRKLRKLAAKFNWQLNEVIYLYDEIEYNEIEVLKTFKDTVEWIMLQSQLHKHHCAACNTIWEHPNISSSNDLQHCCPNCGQFEVERYSGDNTTDFPWINLKFKRNSKIALIDN